MPAKLGIKEGHHLAILDAPPGFELGVLPTGVIEHAALPTRDQPRMDVIVAFVQHRVDLVERIATCRPCMTQAGGLWIAWRKRTKASKVPTDITEDTVREVALPTGLVDNKVCAIDAVWSGLRLVIRVDQRVAEPKARAPAKKPPAPARAQTRRRASPR